MPRFDAASSSMTSSDVASWMETQEAQRRHGVVVGASNDWQFSDFARIFASDVLPVPRGPANRYAWRTRPASIALPSVRTTWRCPTTSDRSCGRYFR